MTMRLLPLALVLALPACATVPSAQTTTQITTAVTRAAAAWDTARSLALLWLPLLPVDRQAQITRTIAIGDRAIAAARVAATAAEALSALTQAQTAMVTVTAALPTRSDTPSP